MLKEKLLLTTKDCNKKLVKVLRVLSIVSFVICYFMLICFCNEMDEVSGRGIWSYEPTISDITIEGWLAIFTMIMCFFAATVTLRQSIFINKAYMEIYESYIKGVCTKNINKVFSVSAMEFQINKTDIVNTSYQRGKFNEGNIMTLYTDHEEYEMPITNNLYMQTIELLKLTSKPPHSDALKSGSDEEIKPEIYTEKTSSEMYHLDDDKAVIANFDEDGNLVSEVWGHIEESDSEKAKITDTAETDEKLDEVPKSRLKSTMRTHLADDVAESEKITPAGDLE